MQHDTPRSFGKWKPVSAITLVCLTFTFMLAGKGMAARADRPAVHSSGVGVEIITAHGHTGGVTDAAFFPGGSKLVTIGGDTTLRVWDTETGALIGLYRGHEAEVNAVAVSPSGTRLVSGDVKGNVLLWSYGSDDGPRTLYTHKGPVQDVVFTADDRALSLTLGPPRESWLPAYGSNDGLRKLYANQAPVQDVVFTDDNRAFRWAAYEQPDVANEQSAGNYLVVHDLSQDKSSPPPFLAEQLFSSASFLGNRYLMTDNALDPLYDLTTWKRIPIQDDWASNWNQEVFEIGIPPQGHLLAASEILWDCAYFGVGLCGLDIVTGNGFRFAPYVGGGQRWKEGLTLVAVDPDSRKIAFFTTAGTVTSGITGVDPYGGLHLAVVSPLRNGFQTFDGVDVEVSDILGLMHYVGTLPELRDRKPDYDSGETLERHVEVGSTIPNLIGSNLLQNIVIQPDVIEDGDFRLMVKYYTIGIYHSDDYDTAVQLLDKRDMSGYCGSGGCGYTLHYLAGMSPDSRLAVVSSNFVIAEEPESWEEDENAERFGAPAQTKVWLYHDAGSVTRAQLHLKARGYRVGEVDGLWGRQTEAAVLAFQRDTHLGQTGVLDRTTRRALDIREELPRPQKGAGWWLEYHLPAVINNTTFGHFGFSPDNRFLALVTICTDCSDQPEALVHLDLYSGALQQMKVNRPRQASGSITAVGFVSDHELLITYARGAVVYDLQTQHTTHSPLNDLEQVQHIRSYNQGALVSLAGKDGVVVIARREAPGQPYTELARVFRSSEEWLAITPEGFFAGSEALARSLDVRIGTQVRKIDQFYQALYRPDLVREKLRGDPDGRVVAAGARLNLVTLMAQGPPPSIAILSPEGGTVAEPVVQVAVEAYDQGGGIGQIEWWVNGIALGLDSAERRIRLSNSTAQQQPLSLQREVPLVTGANRIEVLAYNAAGGVASLPVSVEVVYEGAVKKPRLFVVAAGINKYRDRSLWLNYAVKDVKALSQALRDNAGALFEDVWGTELLDEQVSREGLEQAFTTVSAQVRPEDVFILFLAGHGVALDGRYYFLPADFRYHNEDSLTQAAVSQDHLQEWLSRIQAQKSLVLLDTCNSGSYVDAQLASRGIAEKTAIDKLIKATGRATITASSASQVALEGIAGHGVFTYAFLQGLAEADRLNGNRDGAVTTLEITSYIGDHVPRLTQERFGYEQVPQFNLHGTEFPVVLADTAPGTP